MLISRSMLLVYSATVLSLMAACCLLNFRVYALRNNALVTHKMMETPVGTPLPPLQGHDLQGGLVSQHDLQGDHEKALLLILGPKRSVCERNWPHWKALVAHLPPSVQPIIVDLWDQVSPEYLERIHFPEHDVVTRLTGGTVLNYRLHSVPQTTLLDKQNRVLSSVVGELEEFQTAELLPLAQQ